MNDTEKRELNVWLHEALGNCAHFWTWATFGDMFNCPKDDLTCKKCGIKVPGQEHVVGEIEAPHYTGTDWPDLAEAMRQRGWMLVLKWIPDGFPFLLTNDPVAEPNAKLYRACACEFYWVRLDSIEDHHRRMCLPGLTYADTPGEAVALASKSALEAEVS